MLTSVVKSSLHVLVKMVSNAHPAKVVPLSKISLDLLQKIPYFPILERPLL